MAKILVRDFTDAQHKGVKEAAKARGTSVQKLAKNGILREAGLKTEELARVAKNGAAKKEKRLERPGVQAPQPQTRDHRSKRL